MIYSYQYEDYLKPEIWGGKPFSKISHSFDRSWYGKQTFEQIMENAKHGDASLVDEAEKLIAQLDTDIELEHAQWVPDVYGAYPVVAEYLGGSPTAMRHRTRVPSNNTPIGIWVDLTSSAGISYDVIKRRGIVVLALVLKLQQLRAVDLHCCFTAVGKDFLDLVMPTRPLQLGVVCHVLTCVGFARDIMYGTACNRWKYPTSVGMPVSSDRMFREQGNIPELDVTIAGSHLSQVKEISDSLAWVQGMVNKYVHREE